MKTNNEMVRANRLTVRQEGQELVAVYWRTHKKLAEIKASDTEWKANEDVNTQVNRELFRAWMKKNGQEFTGIQYDDQDRRPTAGKFPSKYKDDKMVEEWAMKMVDRQISEWCPQDTDLSIEFGGVYAMDDKEPKYKDGSWKWAEVEVHVEVKREDKVAELLVVLQVRSGQLTRPKMVAEMGFNKTNFKKALDEQLPQPTKSEPTDLADMTVKALKQIAKDLKIPKYTKMKRDELIQALEQHESSVKESQEEK